MDNIVAEGYEIFQNVLNYKHQYDLAIRGRSDSYPFDDTEISFATLFLPLLQPLFLHPFHSISIV